MTTTESRRERLRRIVVDATREVFTEVTRIDRGRDPTQEILDRLLDSARLRADEMEFPAGFDDRSDAEVAAEFKATLARKVAATRAS